MTTVTELLALTWADLLPLDEGLQFLISGKDGKVRQVPANITAAMSPLHWLRHAHGSHAIVRGGSLPEVQATLGHGNIATTSGYLHARPDSSSGLRLEPRVFLR